MLGQIIVKYLIITSVSPFLYVGTNNPSITGVISSPGLVQYGSVLYKTMLLQDLRLKNFSEGQASFTAKNRKLPVDVTNSTYAQVP